MRNRFISRDRWLRRGGGPPLPPQPGRTPPIWAGDGSGQGGGNAFDLAAVEGLWGAPLTGDQIAYLNTWIVGFRQRVGGAPQPPMLLQVLRRQYGQPSGPYVHGPQSGPNVAPTPGYTWSGLPNQITRDYDNTVGPGGDDNEIPDDAGPSQAREEQDAAAVNSGYNDDTLSGDGIEEWGTTADEDWGVSGLSAILDTPATIFEKRGLNYDGVEMSGRFMNAVQTFEPALGDGGSVTAYVGSLWDFLKETATGAYQVTADAAGKFVDRGSRQVIELRDLVRKFFAYKNELPAQVAENKKQAAMTANYISIAKKRNDNKALAQLIPLRDHIAATGKKLTTAAGAMSTASAKVAAAQREFGVQMDGLGILPLIPIIAILAVAAVVGAAIWHFTSAAKDVQLDRQRLAAVQSGYLPPAVYGSEVGAAGAADKLLLGFTHTELAVAGVAVLGGLWFINRRKGSR